MDKIKTYQEFLNENHLYEIPINEGLWSDIKDKISNYWSELNFEKKVALVDKVRYAFTFSRTSTVVGLLIYILIQAGSLLSGKYMIPSSTGWIVNGIYWLVYLTTLWSDTKLRNIRQDAIQNKVNAITAEFDPKWLFYMFIIIGEKKNVTACLQKLKEDGIITDDLIIETPDGAKLIDLTGKYLRISNKPVNLNIDIDPYGEENWTDDEEIESEHHRNIWKYHPMMWAERIYNVRFRQLQRLISEEDRGNRTTPFFLPKKKTPINSEYYDLYNMAVKTHNKHLVADREIPNRNNQHV